MADGTPHQSFLVGAVVEAAHATKKVIKKLYPVHELFKPNDSEVHATSSSADLPECKEVSFHHGGYDPKLYTSTVMFRLKTRRSRGVRLNTALIILFTLCTAEDMKHVRIARTRGGRSIDIMGDTLLQGSDYYFHCPDPDDRKNFFYQFPLVPALSCWEPPSRVPDIWLHHGVGAKSVVPTRSVDGKTRPVGMDVFTLYDEAVLARDRHCVLSGATAKKSADKCDRAYLIGPRSKANAELYRLWKMYTHLGNRSCGREETSDRNFIHGTNGITLRKDLLVAYNKGEFVFLPAGDYWVAHFFEPFSTLGSEFDQKPIRLSKEIPSIFPLFRVAVAAFALAEGFLGQEA
jgi:hypothetical protein